MPAAPKIRAPRAALSDDGPVQPTPELAAARKYARSLFSRGNKLAKNGQAGRAFEVFHQLRSLFAREPDPAIQELVAKASGLIEELRPRFVPDTEYNVGAPSLEAAAPEQLPMGETEIIAAARKLLSTVYPAEDVEKALRDLAAKTARETTGRAKAKQRAETLKGDDLKLSSKQVAALIADSTLGRLQARYDELLKIKFPAKRLKDVEQARLAAKLSTTFDNLQRRREELGLPPLPKEAAVTKARRLSSAFYRKERAKGPTRSPRRSRPVTPRFAA
jgi:hypothetical protein